MLRNLVVQATVVVTLVVLAAPTSAQQKAESPADEVRAAETAFAKSMADRNLAAFTALLADDTVFWGGKGGGPVLDPKGNRIGTFNSVWQRQSDGAWKIVF